jgi:hypothetical protein
LLYGLESYFLLGSLPKSQDIQDIYIVNPMLQFFQSPPLSIESQVIHPGLEYNGEECLMGYVVVLFMTKNKNKKFVLIDWKTFQKD